jgi:hypothetical protein
MNNMALLMQLDGSGLRGEEKWPLFMSERRGPRKRETKALY